MSTAAVALLVRETKSITRWPSGRLASSATKVTTGVPLNTISSPEEIAEAVLYLTEAKNVTGEILRVDGGAHNGKW